MLSPFRMVCGNFILPEPASYVFFYALFNLRNLLYIIEKVDNNDIWKVHQRAYKKYFARVSKGKMSKPDFEVWVREAARMRDEALAEDEMARDKAAHEQIVRMVTEELNRV